MQEQLKKVEADLKKVEEKRKDLQSKRKRILMEIDKENVRIRAEKNQKIVDIISENFGEVTEENIEILRRVLAENSGSSHRQDELSDQGSATW